MKRAELVFIAPPRVGHITPTIEAAKLITDLYPNFSATVLLMKLPSDKVSIPESRNPRLKFIVLRREESSRREPPPATPQLALSHQVNEHKSHARKIIAEMSRGSSRVAGIVVDMFCTTMIDVAHEFGIPSYLFFMTGAAFLGLMLHMQSLRDEFNVDLSEYEDSDAEILVPTYINPVSARVLPRALFEKGGGGEVFVNHAKQYRKTKGIMINTFQDLESHAMQALVNNATIPPVYAIGPALNLEKKTNQSESILKWLDLHPNSTVIFLCFGSLGTFEGEQVREIAYALENSGCRFLWCLRKPPPKGVVGHIPEDYENVEQVLPEGFLERSAEVGKVIGWAPQVAVLSHPAIGGFVSHCGWNSTLESIWCGVPMATWPIYAEQQVNSFQLGKELEMVVEIKMDHVRRLGCESEKESANNIVSAGVIQSAIGKLMDLDNIGVRKKVKEMQRKSWFTVQEEGSSSAYLKRFLKNVMDNIPS
uniref:Glycosyltransferase n=1 Tax=Rubia yunnanensis TaxID=1650721 RepID=A0A896AGT4_9GENT|nr:glycosyltransferase [Rubia yunnanensis]